jgi:hypothetical protein
MSATTPADLAVAFRSLDRRLSEAIGDADPTALRGLVAELQGHLAAAATAMHTSGDGVAVARAIEARPADDWDETTLDTLRAEALAAGAVLRKVAAAAEQDAD